MPDTSLISGRFVKRTDFDTGANPSDEDIDNFIHGRYGKIRRKELAFLQECARDPYGKKWAAEHQDCIFSDPWWFFGILFAYFPMNQSWEQNYQQLRAMVGPEPMDDINVMIAVHKIVLNNK